MLYNIKTRRKSYITLNKKTTIVKNFSFSLARHTYIKSLCNQKKKTHFNLSIIIHTQSLPPFICKNNVMFCIIKYVHNV